MRPSDRLGQVREIRPYLRTLATMAPSAEAQAAQADIQVALRTRMIQSGEYSRCVTRFISRRAIRSQEGALSPCTCSKRSIEARKQ